MLFLKINVILFALTIGLSSLSIFPYYMHLISIANNIALDVANRNYINVEDIETYIGHLNKYYGEDGVNTYSLLTFKEADIKGNLAGSDESAKDYVTKGVTAFVSPLEIPSSSSVVLKKGGYNTVAVDVETLDGQCLMIDYLKGNFDPINDVNDLVDGMEGNNMNNSCRLVNRGTPFKVEIVTRFKLTGGAFGFMFHSAIPVKVVAVGVTTKYYKYD